jgi:hypothetical protein
VGLRSNSGRRRKEAADELPRMKMSTMTDWGDMAVKMCERWGTKMEGKTIKDGVHLRVSERHPVPRKGSSRNIQRQRFNQQYCI